ncbi:MAG TPA: TIR domain-containing protein, partial [Pyrinomonadaceae bacterium]
MSGHIFISHASSDDDFVKQLRTALEDSGLSVWVDSRKLRGGDKLSAEIENAIAQARQVIVVLSPNTINSPWVRREIEQALQVEKQRKDDGYRVIPLLLPGVQPSALPLWFDEEPVGVKVELKTGGVSEALPAILAALGERLPTDHQPVLKAVSQPLEELVLKLTDPRIETIDNKRRAMATATVIYEPAATGSRAVESKRFTFTAPLGPIETDELSWYLEKYYLWPVGLFKDRAARVEAKLPEWGHDLYQAALASESAREILAVWQNIADGAARCFSIVIDSALPEGTSEDRQAIANEAASELLSLPWELLHDGRGYLFQGARAARVRRRLPNRRLHKAALTALPIRILLVSPRPEDERAAYIDHRLSARPLMDAIDSLGELVKLTVLAPPTFHALEEALRRASENGEGFDAVHFDGHGVFNREHGLGALCFEDPKDTNKLEQRASELIDADKLASVMRHYRIPLVFLEACQTATQEKDPTASVAARLLDEGV